MISALDHVGKESYLLVENFRRVEVLLLFFFGLVCSLCHLLFVDLSVFVFDNFYYRTSKFIAKM